MKELITIIYVLCSDDVECHNFMVNCAVSKEGKITHKRTTECVYKYEEENKRYNENNINKNY